ncbi:putative quinol monooxygenase [Streptomyces sp. NPDC058045]|uniref:putative quinol monooxygenase n=1 Tax=Streptomyces sp. NPDC058045 TaxID=3346311 RepID=UPI0036F17CF9
MIIIAGELRLDPDDRDAYLAGCAQVVKPARAAAGCLDYARYALAADLIEPGSTSTSAGRCQWCLVESDDESPRRRVRAAEERSLPMSTDHSALQALRDTPVEEVRRRAEIVDAVRRLEAGGTEDPHRVGPAVRSAWNDGGGQSTVWYWFPDGRALLAVFDHETDLNLYAEGDYALQLALYDGVPDELKSVVLNQPETYESLNLTDEATGNTVLYAGGVFWYDGSAWQIAEGLIRHVAQHLPDALDELSETGLDYCLATYLLGQDFTLEAWLTQRHGCAEDITQEEREQLAPVFAGQTGQS